MQHSNSFKISDVIKAIGTVFGDIGTSPLYTLAVIILITKPKPEEIFGIVSLMIWTLIVIPTIQYAWFAMNLSLRGEGSIIVLGEIASSIAKSKKLKIIHKALILIGIGFLLGDGIITPAITILSSTEGLRLINGLESLSQETVLFIAISITLVLFAIQKYGTGKIGIAFGPIMIFYFLSIATIGLYFISQNPVVLKALNPVEGLNFIINHPFIAFISLSEIILVATGGEAMYADMGHIGKNAIRAGWVFVFFSVTISYLGQASFILNNQQETNPFFHSASILLGNEFYMLFLILVTVAGIIASQALISGVFSLIFQGINARLIPLLQVRHTSTKLSTQIYIPVVNFFLLIGVLIMFFIFRESEKMASAYGLAVNIDMVITAILLSYIYFSLKKYPFFIGSIGLLLVDLIFFLSNTLKIPHGAYWPIMFAIPPISIISLYLLGQNRIYSKAKFMDLNKFLEAFDKVYSKGHIIKGKGVFLLRDINRVPPYIVETMIKHGIIYEENIFLTLNKLDEPFGIKAYFKEDLNPHIKHITIDYGYQEFVNVDECLRDLKMNERVIFYGVDNVYSNNIIWKLFGLIKRVFSNFADFYKLPPQKVHGVVVRIEI
ncbi:MAG: KUP/HAK/KT family potassium transporter [Hydrogenothermaceae bacterium]